MEPTLTQHIEIRKNHRGQNRAYIAGTRVRVRDIYAHAEVHGETPEEILGSIPHLTLAQVHAALAFYFDNRDVVIDEVRQDDEFVALMKAKLGAGPLEKKLKATDDDGALSSR